MLREVAGKMELGATGRGENVEIGTYIEKSLESELSGNVIDVCPVGALTSKPFRFKARAWELQQHATIAPHDCVGSNLFVHTRRGEVMRVVPRENEDINEVWLSDRDRFSYEGLYSEDRLQAPMVKVDDEWQVVDWETGLQAAVDAIRAVIDAHGADQMGVLASPSATLEELSLLQALARGLGVNNIDHRLRQIDFTDQDNAPSCPTLGQSVAALEAVNAALVIGGNPRKDQPIIGHRLRKAATAGAQVCFINPIDYEFLFDVHASSIVPPSQMVGALAGVAACFPDAGKSAADAVKEAISKATPDEEQRRMAAALKDADVATVLLGNAALGHPQYSMLKALAGIIATASGATLGVLTDGANNAGAWLAGVLPHRGPAGSAVSTAGLDAQAMLDSPRKGYLLFGVEPEHDCANAATASSAMNSAEVVVAITPWASDAMKAGADVLLPMGPFTETSGTYVNTEGHWQSFSYVNTEGHWQSFSGVASPVGDSRPGWKVLRVLGNQFGLDGFEQHSSEEIRDALREQTGSTKLDNSQVAGPVADAVSLSGLQRIGDVALLAVDSLVRRSASLQATPDGEAAARVRMNAAQAAQSSVQDGSTITVKQGDTSTTMVVEISERVPDGCVWLQAGTDASAALGASFGEVSL
jgi:NADH-quinone oxidoreductase subunit G